MVWRQEKKLIEPLCLAKERVESIQRDVDKTGENLLNILQGNVSDPVCDEFVKELSAQFDQLTISSPMKSDIDGESKLLDANKQALGLVAALEDGPQKSALMAVLEAATVSTSQDFQNLAVLWLVYINIYPYISAYILKAKDLIILQYIIAFHLAGTIAQRDFAIWALSSFCGSSKAAAPSAAAWHGRWTRNWTWSSASPTWTKGYHSVRGWDLEWNDS